MSTKRETIEAANRGEGCLGKAHPDEPLFILRASDQFAPELIELWAENVEKARDGVSSPKIRQARALAHQMRAWQVLNYTKTPD